MTVGSYDERTGDLELEPVKGEPRVFVLSGGGSGTAVYRRLQREGTPFAAGILWENDLDYPAARALAAEVVSVKAFCRIPGSALVRAKELIDRCRQVICTLDADGAENSTGNCRSCWNMQEDREVTSLSFLYVFTHFQRKEQMFTCCCVFSASCAIMA